MQPRNYMPWPHVWTVFKKYIFKQDVSGDEILSMCQDENLDKTGQSGILIADNPYFAPILYKKNMPFKFIQVWKIYFLTSKIYSKPIGRGGGWGGGRGGGIKMAKIVSWGFLNWQTTEICSKKEIQAQVALAAKVTTKTTGPSDCMQKL